MTWILDLLPNCLRLLHNMLARIPHPRVDYVVVEVAGSYPEREPPRPPMLQRMVAPPWKKPGESLEALRCRLDRIGAAAHVRGVVLRIRGINGGVATAATVQSLRGAVLGLREKGKRVVAYLPEADLPTYYLAAAADEIWMPAPGHWNALGLRVEVTFLRGALDRAGVVPEYERIAEYKTAADIFMRSGISKEHREVLESVLDSVLAEFTADVGKDRKLEPGALRSAIDQAPLEAEAAREAGLIDGVGYEDELPARLGSEERPAAVKPWALAHRRLPLPYAWRRRRPAIGVVQLVGTIVPGESRELPVPLPLVGSRYAGCDTVARAFRAAERSPRVRAIVFHVDSPGGSALASDLIWREVERLKARKPVVAFMGDVAGSGGYYVSCGASRIVAHPSTITGSIGVIGGKMTARGMLARLGLNREIVARGEAATLESAFEPYTPDQLDGVRRRMSAIYRTFVGKVAAGRGKSEEEVEAVARGRIWTGRQAAERGLVDELGDFTSAVRRARELAGIPEGQEADVITVHPPRDAGVPAPAGSPAGLALGGAVVASALAAWATIRELSREPALLLMED